MTKEEILSEIRRVARERGGRVSIRAFLSATGISVRQILGKYWATWNEVLLDAGLPTATFKKIARIPDEEIFEAHAQLIARLQKWPTKTELELERRRNPSFPSVVIKRRREGNFLVKFQDYCANRPNLALVGEIVAQQPRSEPVGGSSIGRAPIEGHVYLWRVGRRYKIGRTNSLARRFREVSLNQPDPTHQVHSIETDDPNGIEVYWHRRFKSKRVRGTEFFTLDATDVAAFKRRKYQ